MTLAIMSTIKRFLNSIDSLLVDDDKNNAIVCVPVRTVTVTVFKKKQKYVRSTGENNNKCKINGVLDKCMSPFRPETPPGMERVIENKPIRKWSITLYRKKRIFVS